MSVGVRIKVYCRERTEKKSRREAVEWREARYKMVHCEMREGCEGREREREGINLIRDWE